MIAKKPSLRVVLKYSLLQVPSLIIVIAGVMLARRWIDFSVFTAVAIVLLWAAKDAILFPILWRYYDTGQAEDRFAMVGRTGVALTRLDPEGYVMVRGERWRAQAADAENPIEKDVTVRVEEMEGLKVIVVPDRR